MLDLSEFDQLSQKHGKRQRCPLPKLIETVGKEGKVLEAALAEDNLTISAGAIAKWLELRGLEVTVPRITSHRHQTCTCFDA